MELKIPERKVEEEMGRGGKEYGHVIQMTSCHLIAMTALYTLSHSLRLECMRTESFSLEI